MNEAKALRELKRGSQEALGWFITKYNAYVSTIVHNIIGQHMSQADIEETVSDVFISFWNNADKVQSGMAKAYIGVIARNAAKKKLRERGKDIPLNDNILEINGLDPQHIVEQSELHQIVRQAVFSMSQPDREIFLRHYFYCQSVVSICSELGMTQSAVKSRLLRGREKLRFALMEKLK